MQYMQVQVPEVSSEKTAVTRGMSAQWQRTLVQSYGKTFTLNLGEKKSWERDILFNWIFWLAKNWSENNTVTSIPVGNLSFYFR